MECGKGLGGMGELITGVTGNSVTMGWGAVELGKIQVRTNSFR